MPRLSLWRKTKTNDYYFLDNIVREQFHVGGTGAYIHKYIGPQTTGHSDDPAHPNYAAGGEIDPITGNLTNPEGIVNETKIQDLLFMETRDRKYDSDIYEMRGIYNVSDNDFDLTQFGLFLTNDTLFMTFHINEMVEIIGRKLMPGDVIELPHLLDDLSLDANQDPIPKFYVIQDANRGSEGFSATWMPHIWRVKLSPLTDSQEYSDILGTANDENSLKNVISSYKAELNISNAIVEAAEQADPLGIPLADHLFGAPSSESDWDYGESLPSGDTFPSTANEGDYFVRTDFSPYRLFVRRGTKWHRLFDNVSEQTWSERTYNGSTFINNERTTVTGGREFNERQPLSDALAPRADFGGSTSDPLADEITAESTYIEPGYVDKGYVE